MVNYNDGKWHTWDGGHCPVSNRTTVELIRKHKITGELVGYEGHAGETETGAGVNWCNEGADLPIVAFRVIEEHREPREWIVCVSQNGEVMGCNNWVTTSSIAEKRGEYTLVKVQEVLE